MRRGHFTITCCAAGAPPHNQLPARKLSLLPFLNASPSTSVSMSNNPQDHSDKQLCNLYRQCFSTRRLRAIFSPTSVHTGLVRTILARSAFTALTRPPVDSEPMFTIRTSFLESFWTCRETNRLLTLCIDFTQKPSVLANTPSLSLHLL